MLEKSLKMGSHEDERDRKRKKEKKEKKEHKSDRKSDRHKSEKKRDGSAVSTLEKEHVKVPPLRVDADAAVFFSSLSRGNTPSLSDAAREHPPSARERERVLETHRRRSIPENRDGLN